MKIDLTDDSAPLKLSYSRAAIATAISVVVTWIMTALAFLLTPYDAYVFSQILRPTIIIATVVPILVSFPITLILQRGRLKLARALHKLETVHAELEHRSRVDFLTGVLNRETFLSEIERQRAEGVTGAILMVDVDHFKQINDVFGHQAGDDALRTIAATMTGCVRDQDIVGRLGGEEFGVFVPGEDIEMASALAERIRVAISRIQFFPEPGLRHSVTASIGVSQGSADAPLTDQFRLADKGMYAAKHSGRNRVELCVAA